MNEMKYYNVKSEWLFEEPNFESSSEYVLAESKEAAIEKVEADFERRRKRQNPKYKENLTFKEIRKLDDYWQLPMYRTITAEETITKKYYRHKKNKDVICQEWMPLLYKDTIAFSKWKWKNGTCSEEYTFKDLTEDFLNTFDEISSDEYHKIWTRHLNQA